MRTVLTILLTSLFWALVIFLFFEPASSKEGSKAVVAESVEAPKVEQSATSKPKNTKKRAEQSTAQAETTIDYAREIDGKWSPVEGAEYPLEIT